PRPRPRPTPRPLLPAPPPASAARRPISIATRRLRPRAPERARAGPGWLLVSALRASAPEGSQRLRGSVHSRTQPALRTTADPAPEPANFCAPPASGSGAHGCRGAVLEGEGVQDAVIAKQEKSGEFRLQDTDEKLSESTDDDGEDDANDKDINPKKEIRAPLELMAEFLRAEMGRDYHLAKKLCQMILIYEPENPEAKEFLSLIEEMLLKEKEQTVEEEDEDSEEESSDESKEESSEAESEESSGEWEDGS
uniref:Glutamate rich 2 n=1 Tax=Oryctolagus cuniculus TaxID=9986 RepID=A0A5F9C232_RABIT